MTGAPGDLLAVRQYLLQRTGLAADAVGIAGDPAHASSGGYHEGNDDLARVGRLTSDYSKRESSRDQPGTNSASALDIGDFTRGAVTLRSVTLALVAACKCGDPRTRDLREIIYTPDGVNVQRWDRLGIRSTGDSSHLYHTHLSFFRDSEGRRAQPDNILGLLVEFIEGKATAMALDGIDRAQLGNTSAYLQALLGQAVDAVGLSNNAGRTDLTTPNLLGAAIKRIDTGVATLATAAAAEQVRDVALKVAIDALALALTAAGGSVETAAILAHIDARVDEVEQRLAAAAHAAADALDG